MGLRRTIVENGTKRCSRMQTQVTGCSGVQHSRTGQVCDSPPRFKVNHSAKIAREPPDGKEKRGLGPPGSVQDLPASPPEASASKVTPLSGTPSPPKAKTSAQHCGTLPTSPRIARFLLQTPSAAPVARWISPLATVLTVLSFRLAALRDSRCSISGPMPSPDSGLRVPLHGSGRRSNEAGALCSTTGTRSRFLITGTCRSNGLGRGIERHPDIASNAAMMIASVRNTQSYFPQPVVEFTASPR
ncbi:hypothetical protein CNYM01_00408 [Colletotrichum nymphaeae SA-01]|uniref:Uncharacterized protein n=1 Tax=Colletotrichum nymphaeae SA-01 TaxID=1460502 RepID=A0A135TVE5_9PEZI|nr:hypothetical protein CNYM01_00408 [Colletotrichum nymphaeae SA-01]